MTANNERLVTLSVVTYDPEKYLLINQQFGTVYRGSHTGTWKDSGLYLDEEDQLLQRDP